MKTSTYLLLVILTAGSTAHADYFTSAIAKSLAERRLPLSSVAICSVTMITGEENDLCRLYAERLAVDLVACTNLTVVDRQHISRAVKELELSTSGLSADAAALQLGKIVNAQGLINLVIAELSEGTEITVKLIEVETSRLLFAETFRDFREKTVKTASSYQPENNIAGINTKIDSAVDESKTDKKTIYLDPFADQKLGRDFRSTSREELEMNARMFELREHNPVLFEKISGGYRMFNHMKERTAAMLIYIFTAPGLETQLSKQFSSRMDILRRDYMDFLAREQPRLDSLKADIMVIHQLRDHDEKFRNYVAREIFSFVKEYKGLPVPPDNKTGMPETGKAMEMFQIMKKDPIALVTFVCNNAQLESGLGGRFPRQIEHMRTDYQKWQKSDPEKIKKIIQNAQYVYRQMQLDEALRQAIKNDLDNLISGASETPGINKK